MRCCRKCGELKELYEFVMCRNKYTHDCKKCKNSCRPSRAKFKEVRPGQYKCSNCKQFKDLICFSRDKSKKIGHHSHCKKCMSIYKKNKIIDKVARALYNKNYREKNKNVLTEKDRIRHSLNRKNINIRRKIKRDNDISFKIADNLRRRINKVMKSNKKTGSAIRDLDCSIEELKQHLESKFYHDPNTGEVMSWDNYDIKGWHIDHIIPLSSFDLTDREQFLKAAHYTNLQPLWWWQNLSKGDKLI